MQMRKQLATAKIICALLCAILLVACEAPATPRGNTPTHTAVGIPHSIPTATRRSTQKSTSPTTQTYPPCEDAAPPKLSVGLTAIVKWDAVNIRSAPEVPADHTANIVTVVHEGDSFPVVGGPECVYGGYWWLVRIDASDSGWIREASSKGVYISPTNVTGVTQLPTRIPTRVPTRIPTQAPVNGGIRWDQAKSYVGQYKTVCGPVVDTSYPRGVSGQPTFLNIGRSYPNSARFTVVIWGRNRAKFPAQPEAYYLWEDICVEGVIELYEAIAQIEATRQDQINIQ
jgi:hypothetical protein